MHQNKNATLKNGFQYILVLLYATIKFLSFTKTVLLLSESKYLLPDIYLFIFLKSSFLTLKGFFVTIPFFRESWYNLYAYSTKYRYKLIPLLYRLSYLAPKIHCTFCNSHKTRCGAATHIARLDKKNQNR